MHDNPGSVAGMWHLLIVRIGPLRLIYIPATLFRTGIVSDMIGRMVLVLLVLTFYRLFPGVDQKPAQVLIFGGVPRFLGFWLMPGGLIYVAPSFTGVMLPAYQGKVFKTSQPVRFQEPARMLWLLIKGARPLSHAAESARP